MAWYVLLALKEQKSISADEEKGTETFRKHGPCMTTDKWHEVLVQSGFSGVDLEFEDYEDDVCREQSIMISTAATEIATEDSKPVKFVIIADEHLKIQQETATQLSAQLSAQNSQCRVVTTLDALLACPNLQEVNAIFLLEIQEPYLQHLTSDSFDSLKKALLTVSGVLWVISGGDEESETPSFGMASGLGKTLREERTSFKFITAELDSNSTISCHVGFLGKIIEAADYGNVQDMYEGKYEEREGNLEIERLIELPSASKAILDGSQKQSFSRRRLDSLDVKMQVGKPGFLDSMIFCADPKSSTDLAPDEVEIQVQSVGLNTKDCLTALGKIPDNVLGHECSGIITRVGKDADLNVGDRVCALVTDCFRSFVRAKSNVAIRVPCDVDLEKFASVPVAFTTAFLAIHNLAHMQQNESILIHSAADGAGQAAVQVAQSLGAEIFATVSSLEKKKLLIDRYGIPEGNIFSSEDCAFANGIKRIAGRGVDVVLNSLVGEGLIASWEAIAPFGRFIEMGKMDIWQNSSLPMASFDNNVSFHALDISTWTSQRPLAVGEALKFSLDMIEQEKWHMPHPLHITSVSDVSAAFEALSKDRILGKVVVHMRDDAEVPVSSPIFASASVLADST